MDVDTCNRREEVLNPRGFQAGAAQWKYLRDQADGTGRLRERAQSGTGSIESASCGVNGFIGHQYAVYTSRTPLLVWTSLATQTRVSRMLCFVGFWASLHNPLLRSDKLSP